MTNKDITIKNLKVRKDELEEMVQFRPNNNSILEELFEINDTLKKLGENEKSFIINNN